MSPDRTWIKKIISKLSRFKKKNSKPRNGGLDLNLLFKNFSHAMYEIVKTI